MGEGVIYNFHRVAFKTESGGGGASLRFTEYKIIVLSVSKYAIFDANALSDCVRSMSILVDG